MEIFVINLRRDKEKRKRVEELLNSFSFKYKFFNAIDSKRINVKRFAGYNDFKRRIFFGRSLLPKELAIFSSHKKILEWIIINKKENVLIFEDDISFDKNFQKYLIKILKIDYKWDVIRFISNKKIDNEYGRKVIDLGNNHFLKRFPKLHGGAHAYLVSYGGAKKIIAQTKDFYYPIDMILGETWKNNLNSLICNPGLVWQEKNLNIDPPGSIRFIKKAKKLFSFYPWTRLLFKIYESIAKWIFYLYKLIPDYYSLIKYKSAK